MMTNNTPTSDERQWFADFWLENIRAANGDTALPLIHQVLNANLNWPLLIKLLAAIQHYLPGPPATRPHATIPNLPWLTDADLFRRIVELAPE